MKKILSSPALLPFYGLFIKFCFALGWLAPVVWLTLYFCEDYPCPNKKPNALKILALSPARFRGDLDVFSQSGDFEVKALPHFWMCRILYTFYKGKPLFETFYDPALASINENPRFQKFMKQFFDQLYAKTGTDIILSAAVHYISDHLWGKYSSLNGKSFIVIHRESFMASEHIRDQKRDFWKGIGSDFVIDYLISQTDAANQVFNEAGIVTPDKSCHAGTLRMDDFVRKYYKKNTPLPQDKKRVTLFSFTQCFGVWKPVPHWYDDYSDYDGFLRMFEEVHAGFAQFAKAHPDVSCVIKPKWGGKWITKIDEALGKHGLNREEIPNLEILIDVNVHKLIEDSNVVCGYGSTTLLETIVIGGRPIVVPQLGEIREPRNKNKIMMAEGMELFDVAYSMEDFVKALEYRTFENPQVPEDIQARREKLFESWSSSLNADAFEKYKNILCTTVEKKRKSLS